MRRMEIRNCHNTKCWHRNEETHIPSENVQCQGCFKKLFGNLWHWICNHYTAPAMALLPIYPREMKIYVHVTISTQMFTTALFITTKNWKQTNVPCWINGWQVVDYPHHGQEKERTADTPSTPGQLSRELCWVKKSVPRVYVLHDSVI